MMTLHATSTTQEQERILEVFHAGHAMCKAALCTALYALVTLLLAVVHVFTFVVNFAIGTLMIAHALGCMARLLLVLVQERTANPLNTVEGRQ
jgi:Tfp pilus assembly pilus retraction ATPase PilT